VLNIVVRTIRQQLNIRAPDQRSADILRYMKADPQIEGPAPRRLDIEIEPIHGFLKYSLASGASAAGSASHLLSELHRLHYSITRQEHPGCPMVHGGTLTTDDGHVVFVGEKGAGKTTLLVHLASLGWPVTGDEHIIIDGKIAIPRPRSLRVKLGALPFLDARAAEIVRGSPSTPEWHGSSIYAVEPTAFGKAWLIRPCPIRHIVILRSNHGGRSKIRELDSNAGLGLMLPHAILPETGKPVALAWLKSAASSAKCWELWTGRLEDSRDILYRSFLDGNFGGLTRE
jgi:energy-coupling factor transporter ATP-binding protein EcfA2